MANLIQLPVVLYGWCQASQTLGYRYPHQAVDSRHLMYLICELEDSPFQKTGYHEAFGTGEYPYCGIRYVYWWAARPIPGNSLHESYTKIAMAMIPKNLATGTLLPEQLWDISDDVPEYELFVTLDTTGQDHAGVFHALVLPTNRSPIVPVPAAKPEPLGPMMGQPAISPMLPISQPSVVTPIRPSLLEAVPSAQLPDQAETPTSLEVVPKFSDQQPFYKAISVPPDQAETPTSLEVVPKSSAPSPSYEAISVPPAQTPPTRPNLQGRTPASPILGGTPASPILRPLSKAAPLILPIPSIPHGWTSMPKPQSSEVKSQAVHLGRTFAFFVLAVVGVALLVSLNYVCPIVSHVWDRCPWLKSSQAFIKISKSDEKFDCPFGTPVYDQDFVKLGSVDQQKAKQVVVMIFPEYRDQVKGYNRAYYHQEPRKLVALWNVLRKSLEKEEIQQKFREVTKALEPYAAASQKRVIEIIQENYSLEKQKELFKALTDAEFSSFMLRPMHQQWDKLQEKIGEYEWAKLFRSKAVRDVKESFLSNYTRSQIWDDVGKTLYQYGCQWLSSWLTKEPLRFGEIAEHVVGERVEKIVSQPEFQKAAKRSAYDWATQCAEDLKITQKGDIWQGQYTQEAIGGYKQQGDFLMQRMQQKGIHLAQAEIEKFWQKLEQDPVLQEEWRKAEPMIQEKMGAWLKLWADQFFPTNADEANQLQTIATSLMREILYGEPEPILILDHDPGRSSQQIELIRGKF